MLLGLSQRRPQSAGDTPWDTEGPDGPGIGTMSCSHTSSTGTPTKPYGQGQDFCV